MSPSSPAARAKRLEEPKASASSRLFQSPGKRTLLLSLLLVTVVLAVYSPVTHNGFLNYDDDTYLTNNAHVQAGLTWSTVKWAFTTFDVANYHPLTWLSHVLDCQLFGLNPAAHHEGNVLLHAANAVLLFLLLLNATGFAWRSLFVAAVFALHPINVESVAWAAERKNVLSMLFFLLALHAYQWYARQPRLGRYSLVGLLFALGLLSKPQVIALPLLLLLWDYWPLQRFAPIFAESAPPEVSTLTAVPAPARFSVRWLVLEKLPLFALSAASALITMKAQKAGGAVQSFSQYSPLLRLETAVIAYVRYMGKAFWPANLVALYPHPTRLYPVRQVAAAALLLAFITVAVLRARNRRYLVVGWFWFLGSLIPMIGLIQVGAQAIADRYAYIPFIGLFVMLTWLVADWAEAHQVSATWIPPSRIADARTDETGVAERWITIAWLAVPALAALLVLGVLTYRQVGYWHDTLSFWTRTLALTDNNYVAHDALGEYLLDQGKTEEAGAHFRASLVIRPDDLPANLGLGAYEHGHGNLPAAIEHYKIVLNAADTHVRAIAYGNLGSAYRQLGEFAQAKKCFERALWLEPGRPAPMIGLGLIAQKSGDLSEAVRQYSRAMAIEPTDVGYLLMAQALQQEGRSEEAKDISDRVARLSPNLAEAQKEAHSLLEGK